MTMTQEPQAGLMGRLRALYVATAVSSFGDGVFAAAVPLAAAAVTRDPTAVAIVSAAEMVPWVLIGPFAGAVVDRLPYRAVMIVADLARLMILGLVAVAIATGHGSVPLLAGAAFLVMAGTTFFDAASQSIIPELVDRDVDLLNKVNGRQGSLMSAGRSLLGPPAGSAMFVAGAAIPFVANAVSFLVSGVCVFLLRHKTARVPNRDVSILRSIRDGMVWLARHGVLRALAILIAVSNLSYSAATATLVLFAQESLHITNAAYGLLLAVGALGNITGGLLASRVISKIGDARALQTAMAAQVLAWFGLALTANPFVAGATLAVAFMGTSIATVVAVSARQRLTPPDLLGRVVTSFRVLGTGMLPAGGIVGGLLASAWGLRAPLWAAGALLIVPTLLAPAIIGRSLTAPADEARN
ncbi:MFS transporter [Kribbella sp. NPDC051137]|uniref:MFS transporter n=1 Tax=Kribbella sp. NPDC051137 TaxID=3155045 RepID=UPI003448567F